MKKELESFKDELAMADALLRLTTIERLLIKKGVFSSEEYQETMQELSAQIAKEILKKANFSGDIEKMVEDFKTLSKKDSKN